MRSWDSFSLIRACVACLSFSVCLPVSSVFSAEWIERLEVHADPAGGVKGMARIVFPVKPVVIQSILTDFAKWPELFETRMRVASLVVEQGVATVDVRIDHALLPGERQLVSETRVVPDGGMVTDLKSGDFTRYHREWILTPTSDGQQTRADFELLVEIKTVLPDWLVALAMRRELETHFRLLRDKALAKATAGK